MELAFVLADLRREFKLASIVPRDQGATIFQHVADVGNERVLCPRIPGVETEAQGGEYDRSDAEN